MLIEKTLTNRPTGETAVSALMAGFVVWLAGQRVPVAQRQRVYREVERFLAWQHAELPDRASVRRPTVWCYLLRRQHDGESEAEVLKVWGALELLLTYVEGRAGSLSAG
jgi:hypothetical protein